MNKHKDSITTSDDPEGRKIIMDLIKDPRLPRVYPVGRLDRNTTGVILLTNDGELAQRLTHPKYGVVKVYKAVLNKSFSAHCVILKSYVFEELMFAIQTFSIENDVMMANLQKKYNAYSSVPGLTSQIVSFSDIQNSVMDYNWLIK